MSRRASIGRATIGRALVGVVFALGLVSATTAGADSYREPKTGDPAFLVVDPPAIWTPSYDGVRLSFVSADNSVSVIVYIVTAPGMAASPTWEDAAVIFGLAGGHIDTSVHAGKIAGLAGDTFIGDIKRPGADPTQHMVVTIVRLDPSDDAVMILRIKPDSTAEQFAALTDLLTRVTIVGR